MSDSLKAKARRIWEDIFPNADVEGLEEVTHPDVVDHDDPPGTPQGFEGARATMLWLHGVFSDQQWDIHHVLAEGDMVAVHCTMHATHTGDLMGIPATGQRVRLRTEGDGLHPSPSVRRRTREGSVGGSRRHGSDASTRRTRPSPLGGNHRLKDLVALLQGRSRPGRH